MEFINDFDSIAKEINKLNISPEEKISARNNINVAIETEVKSQVDSIKWLRVGFIVVTILFFATSYWFAFYFVNKILTTETELINSGKLNPINRSINSVTISVLLAASVTQTALAFRSASKYLLESRLGTTHPKTP